MGELRSYGDFVDPVVEPDTNKLTITYNQLTLLLEIMRQSSNFLPNCGAALGIARVPYRGVFSIFGSKPDSPKRLTSSS